MGPPIITVTLNPAMDRIVQVPGLVVGEHVQGETIGRIPAGKGINVSRVLGSLGVANIATGFVGRRQLEAYEGSFRGTPITPQLVTVSGDTRENITLVDPTVPTETHIRDGGFEVRRDDLRRLQQVLGRIVRPGAVVIFSGSLAAGMNYQDAIELVDGVQSAGARVAVDGPGKLLGELADHKLWLIAPNVREMAEMTASADSPTDEHLDEAGIVSAGLELAERVEIVLATAGARGAYLFHGGTALRGSVRLGTRRIGSTVGCGDAFVGGFMAGEVQHLDDEACFRQALAVATASTLTDRPGAFDPACVGEMASATTVESLEGLA